MTDQPTSLYCIQEGAAYNDLTTPHFISYETSLYKPGQTSIYSRHGEALLCLARLSKPLYVLHDSNLCTALCTRRVPLRSSNNSLRKKYTKINEMSIVLVIGWHIPSTYSISVSMMALDHSILETL